MQGTDPTALAIRDIHLPESALWWPLAPGWWMVLALILITVATIYILVRRQRRHKVSAAFLAKQELTRIGNEYKLNQDKSNLVKEVSELIRRVSISLFKRNESASLTGQEWLLFLDKLNGDHSFSNGIGRVLIEAPYQASPNYDATKLLHLTSDWIESAARKPL